MHFITDCCTFAVYSTAGILSVFKNMNNRIFSPMIDINRHRIACFLTYGIEICCRRKHFFGFKLSCNLRRTFTRNAKIKYLSNNFSRRIIYVPLLLVTFNFLVTIRHCWRNPHTLWGFHFINGTDFLWSLCSIPFVKNVMKRHHFRSHAFRGINIFLYGYEVDT